MILKNKIYKELNNSTAILAKPGSWEISYGSYKKIVPATASVVAPGELYCVQWYEFRGCTILTPCIGTIQLCSENCLIYGQPDIVRLFPFAQPAAALPFLGRESTLEQYYMDTSS